MVAPAALAIGGPNSTITNFHATEENYASGYTETDDCPRVALVSAGQGSSATGSIVGSTTQQYNVTQLGPGSCIARIADNHGGIGSVVIVSTVYGALAASPATVEIGNGNPTSVDLTIDEASYTGSFTESDNCTGIASVALMAAYGPSTTIMVAQLAAGACTVQVGDDHGGNLSVPVISTTSTVIIDSYGRR